MDYLRLAENAYTNSTSYTDTNYRRQWENNLRLFQNKHPKGSKYLSESYKYRSKNFRPKTRSSVRQNEAAAAAAFFSNRDALHVEPFNPNDEAQEVSAEIRSELLNHRLQYDIPWFQLLVGGMQDANVQGIVASKQYWHVEYRDGEKVKDLPAIDLLPIENIRFDPASDWMDPVNSSPYIILLTPMYVFEVKERTAKGEFKNVSDEELQAAREHRFDTTRQEREGNREDSTESEHELSEFNIVWVHENFMRLNGEDKHYYTLGTTKLLTDPKPVSEAYWTGDRPVVIGCAIIETHKIMPSGPVELGQGLQKEANEIANQRRDNVSLVLNKRYLVKGGKSVDIKSLVRNVAGSATIVNSPEDVTPIEFNDVTGSSYAEQDRINLDFDELVGSFSQSSVQSNRKMNETVGGMGMVKGMSNNMTQYLIQTFSETWVEKVLRQLDKLEQFYETNEELLTMIGQKVGINQPITPELLKVPANVKVNVSNSATDPMFRLQQLLMAIREYVGIISALPPGMDPDEIGKEIFGLLGYRDMSRFFTSDEDQDPLVGQLQQQIAQLTQMLEGEQVKAQAEQQGKLALEEMKLAASMQAEQAKQQAENERLAYESETKKELEQGKAAVELEKTNIVEMNKVRLEQMKQEHSNTENAEKTYLELFKEDANRQRDDDIQNANIEKKVEAIKIEAHPELAGKIENLEESIEQDENQRAQARGAILNYLGSKDDPELKSLVKKLKGIES